MSQFKLDGKIFDVINRRIYEGELTVSNGLISNIEEKPSISGKLILPGLIDAHIHIESSMLVPSEFAKTAVKHGTVAVVSDPHEIANVLGMDGINYMIDNASRSPLKFFFGAPSCVPATAFETSGAILSADDINNLIHDDRIYYLSEMMNYPGVIFDDPQVNEKINHALSAGKPIDGHAPGLVGKQLQKYINCGITTDHECSSLDEALEKISLGMKILIRNGSAAKNFEALHQLIQSNNDMVMLCSDDLHPDDLLRGHINLLVKMALSKGHDIFDILTACCLNPVKHYKLPVGLLQKNSPADFIIVDNLNDFNVERTFIDGNDAYSDNDNSNYNNEIKLINNFSTNKKEISDFIVPFKGGKIRVIEIIPGEIITDDIELAPTVVNGCIVPYINRDLLKITVVNRYQNCQPAVAFIRNFGIKSGAVASSIAHDSHNIVCIGTNDEDIVHAVNAVISCKGGIAISNNNQISVLPLPVAGIISDKSCEQTAEIYSNLDEQVRKMGSKLTSPLMTLSFMALIVIPKLKLSDKGLFDVLKFALVDEND